MLDIRFRIEREDLIEAARLHISKKWLPILVIRGGFLLFVYLGAVASPGTRRGYDRVGHGPEP